MFRNRPIQKRSHEFVQALQSSALAESYSPLTTSILGRFIAVDVEVVGNSSSRAVHLYKPRKWQDESIGVVVSSAIIRHTFSRVLLAHTIEQSQRAQSVLGNREANEIAERMDMYTSYSTYDSGFEQPLEVFTFNELAEAWNGQPVLVRSRPVVLVDEVSVADEPLSRANIESMAESVNEYLLHPVVPIGERD